MEVSELKRVVEGALLASGRPLSLRELGNLFDVKGKPDNELLRQALAELADECDERAYELKEVASGFRFQVKSKYGVWVSRLWEEKPPRYSRALLETLALVAYKQPITRGEIEDVRGVAVSTNIIRSLLERGWVRVVGHRDVPGKPAMYATTREFLDYFNLKGLSQLPSLADIKEIATAEPELELDEAPVTGRSIELPVEDLPAINDEQSVEAEVSNAASDPDQAATTSLEVPDSEQADTVPEPEDVDPDANFKPLPN